MSLLDHLTVAGKREQVIKDASKVLDAEVSDKSGITGIAVKGAFKVVRGLQPDFVPSAIDALLDDFVRQIEPFFNEWKARGKGSLRDHLVANGPKVADALLSITDDRAAKSKHRTLVKTYEKLRPRGKEHVVAAMPRVGALIERHTQDL
jgi:hypothetical protein